MSTHDAQFRTRETRVSRTAVRFIVVFFFCRPVPSGLPTYNTATSQICPDLARYTVAMTVPDLCILKGFIFDMQVFSKEVFSKSDQIKPNLNCNYTFSLI